MIIKYIGIFFCLIRWPNLLIIALSQFTVWQCLSLSASQSPILGSEWFLLCGGTLSIAAAGYLHNDIADSEIDLINKADKQWIGRYISEQTAWYFYVFFNTLALFAAFSIGSFSLGVVFIGSAIGLWLYSAWLKKTALWGNIVVALLSALSFALIGIREWELLSASISDVRLNFLAYYLGFAFICSLIRELVKDIEDLKGDAALGAKTLPIVVGVLATRRLLLVLCSILVLLFVPLLPFESQFSCLFIFIFLISPLPFGLYFLFFAQSRKDFSKLSLFIKIYMLLGLLWLWWR